MTPSLLFTAEDFGYWSGNSEELNHWAQLAQLTANRILTEKLAGCPVVHFCIDNNQGWHEGTICPTCSKSARLVDVKEIK